MASNSENFTPRVLPRSPRSAPETTAARDPAGRRGLHGRQTAPRLRDRTRLPDLSSTELGTLEGAVRPSPSSLRRFDSPAGGRWLGGPGSSTSPHCDRAPGASSTSGCPHRLMLLLPGALAPDSVAPFVSKTSCQSMPFGRYSICRAYKDNCCTDPWARGFSASCWASAVQSARCWRSHSPMPGVMKWRVPSEVA